MTRTVHPNAVTSPHNIESGGKGLGLRIFVTDCSSLKFRNTADDFQKQLKEDVSSINSSTDVLIFAG